MSVSFREQSNFEQCTKQLWVSPSSTQTSPFQLSLNSQEWGCSHREFVFGWTLLPSSCSDASFCASGLDHKHFISGQGLHQVSRIPPLLHSHQPSVMWVWTKSVGCFVLWSLCASLRSPRHLLPTWWGLNLAGTNSCSMYLSVYKCWWSMVPLQISLQTNSGNSNVCWKTKERDANLAEQNHLSD